MRRITSIILHHSATLAKAYEGDLDGSIMSKNICANHYRNWGQKFPDYKCDYHFLIGSTGKVFEGQPLEQAGWHCGNYEMNLKSIGICFLGNFEKNIMPEKQMMAGAELIEDLRIRFDIDKVLQHKDVVPTLCPGKFFPFKKMTEEVIKPIDPHLLSEADKAIKFVIENKIFQPPIDTEYFLDEYFDETITKEELAIFLYRFKKLLEKLSEIKVSGGGSTKHFTII